ncbi:MAG: type I restriction-modification system subunit M [Bacteroidetes bacterium]|nr:type I restriction-modification system subunit M [Bacteroidota bacterium]
MPIKKTELYSSLWKSCDELRGGMDASQYKDYVLVLLFVKYISDKYHNQKFSPITIPEDGSFKDMIALKGKAIIGDGINKIIGRLADANRLNGTIDVANFNDPEKLGSGKEMIDRLTNLIAIFESDDLDFSNNRADGDDILGDAYEYLMRHFATESGKSKGQFYTPAEVSRILAKVLNITNANSQTSAYDPTCGSGSLLLKVADEADANITLYGQENDVATTALARMNMILHNYATATIKQGNTIANPYFVNEHSQLKTFDYVVANPPFSNKNWSSGIKADDGSIIDTFERFKNYGTPPPKNGDYAFLLHIVRSLKSTAKGAVILPHGVLFRGNAEATIRQNLIRKGYIKGIIGLPANLFYGTGIPACIIVIDKENASTRKGIFMVDASKGFIKDGNKNRLRDQDIHKIVDIFNRMQELPKYSRMVTFAEIEQNEYNLNIPRYIDSQVAEDKQDIKAHLKGGIPEVDINALENYWSIFNQLRQELFKPFSDGYVMLKVSEEEIKNIIYNHPQFNAFASNCQAAYTRWKETTTPLLENINEHTKPKKLIYTIGESILATYAPLQLIDKYNVYQHLLNYWNATMQDDAYIIVSDGWQSGNEIVYEKDKKGNTDYSKWEGKLIPKALLIDTYFQEEQIHINNLQAQKENILQLIQDFEEEHNVEGGLLEDAINDKDKITAKSVADRLKKIKDDKEATEEIAVLKQYLKLSDEKKKVETDIKKALQALEVKVLAQYKVLSIADIKEIVTQGKWLTQLQNNVNTELQQISQNLTQRIKQLALRYHTTLSQQTNEVASLETKVNNHLKAMGYE